MEIRVFLLLPLLSSVLYVAGALFIKRTAELQVGIWRTTFVTNLAGALMFLPLLALGGPGQPVRILWQPAVVALLFLLGQILSFTALSRGDVSVATPILGIKTVLVPLFVTWILADTISVRIWISAGMSTIALALLNRAGGGRHHDVGLTILLSMAAAGCYALFDVLVQKWSPAWGAGRFLPAMMTIVAGYSVALIPFFHAPLRAIPKATWPWVLAAAGMIGLQGIILICTLAIFGNATSVNVVYSSRGLWSVMAVWLVGHWFHNTEQQLGGRVLGWRLAGAALIMAAIGLVLI